MHHRVRDARYKLSSNSSIIRMFHVFEWKTFCNSISDASLPSTTRRNNREKRIAVTAAVVYVHRTCARLSNNNETAYTQLNVIIYAMCVKNRAEIEMCDVPLPASQSAYTRIQSTSASTKSSSIRSNSKCHAATASVSRNSLLLFCHGMKLYWKWRRVARFEWCA